MITEEQIIKILKSYSTYTDRSRTDECVHESNFDLIAKDVVKKLTINGVSKSFYCKCNEPLELRMIPNGTPYCEECGKNIKQ